MFCGLHFDVYGINIPEMLEINKFDFYHRKNQRTGRIMYHEAKWKHFYIKVKPHTTYLTFKGSIHKSYHGDNYNRFTHQDLLKSMKQLSQEFGIVPKRTKIRSFEFGVNLHIDRDPRLIIERIIAYRQSRFCQMKKGQLKKILGIYCELDRMKIKIYNKSEMSGLDVNILRIEVVIKKMVQVQKTWKLDVRTLNDLAHIPIWRQLEIHLLNTFDRIIMDEIEDETLLDQRDLLFHLRYRNSDGLERTKREIHRNTFGKHIAKFCDLQGRFGYGLKNSIRDNIERELLALKENNVQMHKHALPF